MNKKAILIISGIWILLAFIIFIIYTLQSKNNADIIFKEIYLDVKNSKIIKEKIGKVDNVYVKNIYHFGKQKGTEYFTDLKVVSNGKKYYIKSITGSKMNGANGYIIDDKRYDEFKTFNLNKYSNNIENNKTSENIGNYKDYEKLKQKINTLLSQKYNIDLKNSVYEIYYNANDKMWLLTLNIYKNNKITNSYYNIVDQNGNMIAMWHENK